MMTIRIRDSLVNLERDGTWHTSDPSLRDQLKPYTLERMEAALDPRFQPRELAYALAYLVAHDLGGSVVREVEEWGYPPITQGVIH